MNILVYKFNENNGYSAYLIFSNTLQNSLKKYNYIDCSSYIVLYSESTQNEIQTACINWKEWEIDNKFTTILTCMKTSSEVQTYLINKYPEEFI